VSPETPKYKQGEVVRRKSAPDKVGQVREARWNEQAEEWTYRVQFGGAINSVPESDLEYLPEIRDAWEDLARGRVDGPHTLHRLLTFERLRKPPTRLAASFGVARARLLPYQFKPLLKFLENPLQRLLIADDVGLGKTVEAGYILKELLARQPLERVLIVVPARLKLKWKTELEKRFDEVFETVGRAEIRDRFLDPIGRGREAPTFRWIASYESARAPDIEQALRELQPTLDLVVLDEAHRVRNFEAKQHQLARALANCADALLFLTATPIQTGRENLFALVNLLDPDQFARQDVFEEQLEANRPIVRALNALRGTVPQIRIVRSELQKLTANPLTKSLTSGSLFQMILDRLDHDELDRAAIVELQRDISAMGLLSQILSRTRKVEVLPDRPSRHAQAVEVDLTPEERRVYQSASLLSMLMKPWTSGWGASMAALMALRMTASCIPAAIRYFRERVGSTIEEFVSNTSVLMDEDRPDDVEAAGAAARDGFWDTLRDVLENPPEKDSKFERFWEAIQTIWSDDRKRHARQRKIIVFAFFRRTLEYLAGALGDRGINYRLIHGGLAMNERVEAMDAFLDDDAGVQVLLSSEVGSEGLDLQAASVVVNYDLPWNPMVVEQRIGRIDRIGQRSPTLTIVNLVLKHTIEDEILMRLYNRIGIFEETIGEIDPILGERVQNLIHEALENALTPQEMQAKAEEAAQAILNRQRDVMSLERDADQLIASDQAFLDEINSLIGDRRVPASSELYRFIKSFLEGRYPGSEFPQDVLTESARIHLHPQLASDMLQSRHTDQDWKHFTYRVQAGGFWATMDPDTYLQRPRGELISLHHPLVRFACSHMGDSEERLHRTFTVQVPSETTEPGEYVLLLREFEIGTPSQPDRLRRELRPLWWSSDSKTILPADEGQALYVQMLDHAGRWEVEPADSGALSDARDALESAAAALEADLKRKEKALASARAERRRSTQRATLEAKVTVARNRLSGLRSRRSAEFALRMAEAKLAREEGRLAAFERDTDAPGALLIESRDVAVARVLVVREGQR